MKKSKDITIAFILVMALGSAIWYLIPTEEAKVVLAAFNSISEGVNVDAVAWSVPSNCSFRESDKPNKKIDENLFKNFLAVNDERAKPIRLRTLEGKYPVLKWKENKAYLGMGRPPINRSLIGVSRVGFDKNKEKAIFCLVSSGARSHMKMLVYLEKQYGKWVFIDTLSMGVS